MTFPKNSRSTESRKTKLIHLAFQGENNVFPVVSFPVLSFADRSGVVALWIPNPG
jgi:hypothetical protein